MEEVQERRKPCRNLYVPFCQLLCRWSTGTCQYSTFCRFAHPTGIDTNVTWINEHPTEYFTAMVRECTICQGLRLNPILSLMCRLNLPEWIDYDILVMSIEFEDVWIWFGDHS